ncbi:hypothetical protein MMC10_011260 [Thelotrema lepadinum]|nr:hypothetical protein [Thelotrema lepadinum]
MPNPQLPKTSYTIGWICALSYELTAAIELLDEEHGSLPQPAHDTNNYTYGRMGVHNVVIACLPAGRMGNNPATHVGSLMKANFPSLRFGLLVGIGGGIPSKDHDIRLGDVVVSQPQVPYGGVVQYDMGKALPGGGFLMTGFLNSPPTVLLGALQRFTADIQRRRSRYVHHLSRFERLPEFLHPGAQQQQQQEERDGLFEASYEHVGGADCRGCDSERLIGRPPRGSRDPCLHFGTIASGNAVIKDAEKRDRLARAMTTDRFGQGFGLDLGQILCYEMEAAGLMNTFDCLVVRGISDYADSHKNDVWKPYAAAAAAACAKEILGLVSAVEVTAQGPMAMAMVEQRASPAT